MPNKSSDNVSANTTKPLARVIKPRVFASASSFLIASANITPPTNATTKPIRPIQVAKKPTTELNAASPSTGVPPPPAGVDAAKALIEVATDIVSIVVTASAIFLHFPEIAENALLKGLLRLTNSKGSVVFHNEKPP